MNIQLFTYIYIYSAIYIYIYIFRYLHIYIFTYIFTNIQIYIHKYSAIFRYLYQFIHNLLIGASLRYFLSGPVASSTSSTTGTDAKNPNPYPDWLSDNCWKATLGLEELWHESDFALNLAQMFTPERSLEWKILVESSDPFPLIQSAFFCQTPKGTLLGVVVVVGFCC